MQLIIFLLILSLLVLVHELGHFVFARWLGMRVEEFGIGLPPKARRLFWWRGVEFSLNWLPIGGFVRLYGEDPDTVLSDSQAFFNRPMWHRLVVLVAGVVMNFVLGVVLFSAVYSYLGIPTKTERVRVVGVMADSPAKTIGLKEGDIITDITSVRTGEVKVTNLEKFIGEVNEHKGEEISLYLADGRQLKVVPRTDPPAGQGALGVSLSSVEMLKYPWWQMPFRGAVVGVEEAVAWGKEIAASMYDLVANLIRGKGLPKDVTGPVGIYKVSTEVYKNGLIATLQFVAILSINLAILNIMPLPALDGGRIAFLAVELIVGKKRKNRVEGYVHTVGMVLLMGLMLLITVRDVWRLFR